MIKEKINFLENNLYSVNESHSTQSQILEDIQQNQGYLNGKMIMERLIKNEEKIAENEENLSKNNNLDDDQDEIIDLINEGPKMSVLKNENNNRNDINDAISYNENIEILKNDMNLFKNILNEIQKNYSNNEDEIFEKYVDILKSKIEYEFV
jgi:tRNA U34 5-carboxymethylaminomethyl modifying GTPase MnmE/TrmE